MSDHPNRLSLEQLSVGDLPAALRDEVERHVAGCATCRSFVEELEAEHRARLIAVPASRFMDALAARRDRQKRSWSRWAIGFGVGAAAFATAAVAVLWAPSPEPVRWKGAGVAIYRSRAGTVDVLGSAETIRAGDALRVVLNLSEPQTVMVWVVDAGGRVDRLLPDGPLALPAGENALPGSAVVESPCVDMWLVVVPGVRGSGDDFLGRLAEAARRGALAQSSLLPKGAFLRLLRCES